MTHAKKKKKKKQSDKRALKLRLYIAGSAPNSTLAIANARSICVEHFGGVDVLEIVDLLQDPELALLDGIIVTPTLLRVFPLPISKVIGNLNEKSAVLLALGAAP